MTGLQRRPSWAREPKPAKPDPITPEVRRLLRQRSGGICEVCQSAPATHAHHRQLRRFGDHRIVNLLHIDSTCHHRIHNGHRAEAEESGWLLTSQDDAATAPVVAAGRLCLLRMDGSYRPVLASILDAFPADHPQSCVCQGTGYVCEDHPDHAWAGMTGGDECCGGAGAPCQGAAA